jgi:hypothetical protein
MRVDASAVVCAVFVLVAACSETPPAVSARHEVPPDKPAPPRQNLAKQARKPGALKGKTDTEPDTPTLPQECAGGGERCFPPPEFVREICRGKHLSVALAMFNRSAPWEHVFVQVRDVAAVNQLGGPVGDPRLVYSEEVILLQHRPYVPRDGFDMKAPDNYDVLRLDGSCATLAEDEFRVHRPKQPRYAPVVWKYLDSGLQDVLLTDDKVEQARTSQREDCGGMYLGGGSVACQKATQKLARAILAVVNDGVELPPPEDLPVWSRASD